MLSTLLAGPAGWVQSSPVFHVKCNWTARDLPLDCSFLGAGAYEAVIFQDGLNVDRDATDYRREVRRVTAQDKLALHLGSGGG